MWTGAPEVLAALRDISFASSKAALLALAAHRRGVLHWLTLGREEAEHYLLVSFRQPGYLLEETLGLCAPALRRVCLYRGAGAAASDMLSA